jgi:hypothetical protein
VTAPPRELRSEHCRGARLPPLKFEGPLGRRRLHSGSPGATGVVSGVLATLVAPTCRVRWVDAGAAESGSEGGRLHRLLAYWLSGSNRVYELLIRGDNIRATLARQGTAGEMRRLAIDQGMRTLKEDGVRQVRMGVTTTEEVRKACGA